MGARPSRSAALLAGVVLVAGCGGTSGPDPFTISIKVESDPGKPIAGATISRETRLLGTTGADGRVTLRLPGVD